MKLSKFDIGAEIISIITKGMYPDPKDALREYIQNGIDATAVNVSIKIRQESIVIEDDGTGMNRKTLRDSVRMGVSDKNPSKDIGFMGIGIYSSFHLCGRMTIFSRGSEDVLNVLSMDFAKMKQILASQKELRLEGNLDSSELMDLQSLLESCIELTDNGEANTDEFPIKGTRVELSNVEGEFYSALSNFEEVSEYLQSVIPLHFDRENFSHAEEIENKISMVCREHNHEFELINLSLQVNSELKNLYRPYKDIDFKKSSSLKPHFEFLKDDSTFFGLAWGCLSSERAKLTNKANRGFIIKKQGFSIGTREKVVKYFPKGNTYFDRYSGEIIIIHPSILPNASRNDIEYSPLRSILLGLITDVADKFDDIATIHQEESKADEDLASINQDFKIKIANYNEYEEDSEVLIDIITKLKNIIDRLNGRIKRRAFSQSSNLKAKNLLSNIESFEQVIKDRVRVLTEKKSKKNTTSNNKTTTTKVDIAKNVSTIDIEKAEDKKNYEDLLEMLSDLEYDLNDNVIKLIDLIDELFVQSVANSKGDYYKLLQNLKERLEDGFE